MTHQHTQDLVGKGEAFGFPHILLIPALAWMSTDAVILAGVFLSRARLERAEQLRCNFFVFSETLTRLAIILSTEQLHHPNTTFFNINIFYISPVKCAKVAQQHVLVCSAGSDTELRSVTVQGATL